MRNYWCPDCEKEKNKKTKKKALTSATLCQKQHQKILQATLTVVSVTKVLHMKERSARYSQLLRFIYSYHGDEGAGEESEREGGRGYHVNGGVMFL